MKKILILLCCGLVLGAKTAGAQEPAPQPTNRLLKEELALAKSPSLYFIVFLRARRVELKSRGLVLREWKVESLHRWGDPPPLLAVTLENKSTLFPPKRAEIRPATAEEEGTTFELEALELKDMPSTFVLYLERGAALYIRPRPQGFISRLGSFGHALSWYLWVPLKNLWLEAKKRPFAAIDIEVEGIDEAKAMYWAFPDGIKGIISPL